MLYGEARPSLKKAARTKSKNRRELSNVRRLIRALAMLSVQVKSRSCQFVAHHQNAIRPQPRLWPSSGGRPRISRPSAT